MRRCHDDQVVDSDSRRREGIVLAGTLVGLTQREALAQIAAAGFEGVSIRAEDWVQGDDAFNRIRVWVDEDGQVIRARAE